VYKEKGYAYYSHVREDLINLISGKDNRILDIGCGVGETGKMLKKMGKAKEVVGIEMQEEIALKAKEQLDKVICGDIEKMVLPFEDEYFDYIIMGDVIEHLIDPWETIRKLRRYLSESGYLLASTPNIAYWRVLRDLVVFDMWEYQKAGILDNCHLRFFTRKTILKLFEETGYEVRSMLPGRSNTFKFRIFNFLTMGILKRFFALGYLIKAQRTP
jgi:SAM-dependent methyltransferase